MKCAALTTHYVVPTLRRIVGLLRQDATAAMTVVVLILGELAAWMQVDSPLARLALLSFTGAVIYGATLFAIGSPVISEGRRGAGMDPRSPQGRQLTLAGQIRQRARVLDAPSPWWACLIS
jgi:hypothetical protein